MYPDHPVWVVYVLRVFWVVCEVRVVWVVWMVWMVWVVWVICECTGYIQKLPKYHRASVFLVPLSAL